MFIYLAIIMYNNISVIYNFFISKIKLQIPIIREPSKQMKVFIIFYFFIIVFMHIYIKRLVWKLYKIININKCKFLTNKHKFHAKKKKLMGVLFH